MNRWELEERMIDFVVKISRIAQSLPVTKEGLYYKDQLIRSSGSAALNYAETMSAESKKDFIHKTSIVLKELRETYISLKIISRLNLCKSIELILNALNENNELISIFVKALQTSQKNLKPKR